MKKIVAFMVLFVAIHVGNTLCADDIRLLYSDELNSLTRLDGTKLTGGEDFDDQAEAIDAGWVFGAERTFARGEPVAAERTGGHYSLGRVLGLTEDGRWKVQLTNPDDYFEAKTKLYYSSELGAKPWSYVQGFFRGL